MTKYAPYADVTTIKICADTNNTLTTLEPQIVEINDLAVLNKVLNKEFHTKKEITDFMIANKTECALALFETKEKINWPVYIEDAIRHE